MAKEENKADFRKLTNENVKVWFKKKFGQQKSFPEIEKTFGTFIKDYDGNVLADLEKSDWITGMKDLVLGASIHKKIQDELGKGGGAVRDSEDAQQMRILNNQLLLALPLMVKVNAMFISDQFDAWDGITSASSKAEKEAEKKKHTDENSAEKTEAAKHYDRQVDSKLTCMLTGLTMNASLITLAHIHPKSKRGKGLQMFGLRQTDYKNVRNKLLLFHPIEKAFDQRRLCFVENPLQKDQIFCKILDSKLATVKLRDSLEGLPPAVQADFSGRHEVRDMTFGDLHGKPLLHPQGRSPYMRLLDAHSRVAHQKARQELWITDEQANSRVSFRSRSPGGESWLDDLQLLSSNLSNLAVDRSSGSDSKDETEEVATETEVMATETEVTDAPTSKSSKRRARKKKGQQE